MSYPGANVQLAPPPAGAVPAITPAGALNAYLASGVFPGVSAKASGPADVRLVSYSDNTQGEVQPDGTVRLTFQRVLAYAVIFHDVPYNGSGGDPAGASNAPIPTDIVVMIDAGSGKMLGAFADKSS